MPQHHSRIFIGHPTRTLRARPTRSTSGEDKTGLGLRRRRPRTADARLPITPLILTAIGHSLKNNGDAYEQLLVWAACCLGFFAFWEFTGSNFDRTIHLTSRDIAVDSLQSPTMLKVRLKASKTDPTKRGVDLFIGRTWNSLCPVVALLRYLAVRGVDDGPLFREQNGAPLSRQSLVKKVRRSLQRAGIDPSLYAGHSFRIGAATTAASRGISDATIQILGRWSSDSYTRYIRTPRQTLASMSQLLAT